MIPNPFWPIRVRVDGDVILFWLTCLLAGVVLAYLVVTHTPYWCER